MDRANRISFNKGRSITGYSIPPRHRNASSLYTVKIQSQSPSDDKRNNDRIETCIDLSIDFIELSDLEYSRSSIDNNPNESYHSLNASNCNEINENITDSVSSSRSLSPSRSISSSISSIYSNSITNEYLESCDTLNKTNLYDRMTSSMNCYIAEDLFAFSHPHHFLMQIEQEQSKYDQPNSHELAIRVDDQLIFPSENGKQFHDDVSLLNDCSISDVM